MRAHTEYCPHLIWLLLLKNKFLLSGIVNEYRYQQRYNTLRNHIMQLNMFVRIQKFGQGDSAARIEHPADAPDDKIAPGYTLFLALGIAEHITVIQYAVGNAATYHSQRIGKSVLFFFYI